MHHALRLIVLQAALASCALAVNAQSSYPPGLDVARPSQRVSEPEGDPTLLARVPVATVRLEASPTILGGQLEGTPVRRPGLAVVEVFGVNLFYGLLNQVLPSNVHEHYHVSFRSWKANLRGGFSWDDDPFQINQFGHSYQGGNYFTVGRSLGLRYWESLPLAALGSVTWELFGENTRPSWNDLINTTLGGAAFGEVMHRMAWLVRAPEQTGPSHWWREVAALGLDPVGGLNRLALGEAWRVAEKPSDLRPSRLAGEIALGMQWVGRDRHLGSAARTTQGTFALDYGALHSGPSRSPFDAFSMSLRAGGGALVSGASIRGRLAGRRLGAAPEGSHQWVLVQGYDYDASPSFLYGGQSLLAGVADRFDLPGEVALTTLATAGPVLLGAIDSPASEPGTRPFDYGAGIQVSGTATLTRRGSSLARLSHRTSVLRTVTRTPAGHVLTVLRGELRVPIRSRVFLGLEGEWAHHISRPDTLPVSRRWYPQLRAHLVWQFRLGPAWLH